MLIICIDAFLLAVSILYEMNVARYLPISLQFQCKLRATACVTNLIFFMLPYYYYNRIEGLKNFRITNAAFFANCQIYAQL